MIQYKHMSSVICACGMYKLEQSINNNIENQKL